MGTDAGIGRKVKFVCCAPCVSQGLCKALGKKLVELTGDFTPDLRALLAADVIVATPEKWDGISRNWQARSYVTKVSPVGSFTASSGDMSCKQSVKSPAPV